MSWRVGVKPLGMPEKTAGKDGAMAAAGTVLRLKKMGDPLFKMARR